MSNSDSSVSSRKSSKDQKAAEAHMETEKQNKRRDEELDTIRDTLQKIENQQSEERLKIENELQRLNDQLQLFCNTSKERPSEEPLSPKKDLKDKIKVNLSNTILDF